MSNLDGELEQITATLQKIEQHMDLMRTHLSTIAAAVSMYTNPHPCTRQNEASAVQSKLK